MASEPLKPFITGVPEETLGLPRTPHEFQIKKTVTGNEPGVIYQTKGKYLLITGFTVECDKIYAFGSGSDDEYNVYITVNGKEGNNDEDITPKAKYKWKVPIPNVSGTSISDKFFYEYELINPIYILRTDKIVFTREHLIYYASVNITVNVIEYF